MNIRTKAAAVSTLAVSALVLVLGACGAIPPDAPETSPTGNERASPSTQTSGTTGAPSSPAATSPRPSAPTPSGEPSTDSTEPARPVEAVVRQVPRAQWTAMKRAGMLRPECPVTERKQLRRVDVPYVDFNGDTRLGHLVVRSDAASSTARIFTELFRMQFPIRRMQGVETYDGDVYKSLRADNTSAYNCRRAGQTNAPYTRSPHANGRAVDINPVENPWMDPRCRCWSPTAEHAARTKGPGKILENDRVWQLFDDEGWIWQNIDVADYMHFDTGYPSKPYRRP